MGLPPVDRSTLWPYEDGEPGEFYYQRYAHPTGVAAEQALGELDGGEALLFSSGTGRDDLASCSALLGPGDTIAVAEGCYFGTPTMFGVFERWGLKHVEFDQTGPPPEGVQLVWLEAPSNPFLTMPDFEAAAAHPAPVLVDATAATPIHLRPLEHGADLVLHSATKYLGGHSDVLLGAVDLHGRRDSRAPSRVPQPHRNRRRARPRVPLAPRPQDARSCAFAARRRPRPSSSAASEEHPKVERVRYPGFGGMLSFDVAGDAREVETSTRLIRNATSLGGVESTMESRYRWEGDRVPENLLRLSVGLEDVDELWADLEQALPGLSSKTRVTPTRSRKRRSCVTRMSVPSKALSARSSSSTAGRSRWFVGSSSTRQPAPRAAWSASSARVRSPGERRPPGRSTWSA